MKLGIAFAAALTLATATGGAQIAVSGNDGKQVRPGDDPPGMRPDTVSVIDLNHYPPKVLASVNAPASLIGPPDAVAVAPDSSYAIVTCGQKPDPADPTKLIPDDTVSVIDLSRPKKPRVIQTLAAGSGASGVSINPAGTIALVASSHDGAVTVFSIAHKKLTRVGQVQMEQGAGSTDVVFSPDGKRAFVVERGGNRVAILDVDGNKVTYSGQSIITGASPYGMTVTPDGKYGVDTNLGGALDSSAGGAPHRGQPRPGTITLIDLNTNKVVDSAVVGETPEHVVLSPDGNYLEVTVANGSAVPVNSPKYNSVHGLMRIFRVSDGKLTEVASTNTGHWCQGATWSRDGRTILLQCATEYDIEVYKFDGKTVVQDTSATLKFSSRPGSIATATNQ
ncbi:MAG TPA: YncE family protein [Acidobacteriaceae bacterium]|nr:YncE family protein [Acidobacteriaceae bacterium]